MMTRVAALKTIALASCVGAGIAALAIPTKPALADASDCSGMALPLCNTTRVCDTVGTTIKCHTDNYYHPSPE
jgi:hypothetical protein